MKTTLPKAPTAMIEWPGAEPVILPRAEAITQFRAAAFLGEPVRIKHLDEGWKTNRDIARPWGMTDAEAAFATHLLLHRMMMKIGQFLPANQTLAIIDIAGGKTAEEMIEIGDGWTIAPTIEIDRGFRGAIKWHAYDPEGAPIIENTTEQEAVAALAGRIAAYNVATTYHQN